VTREPGYLSQYNDRLRAGWTRGRSLSPNRGKTFLSTSSRPVLGLTQSPTQWVPRDLSLGVKRSGREADHSLPSSAEDQESADLYIDHPYWTGMLVTVNYWTPPRSSETHWLCGVHINEPALFYFSRIDPWNASQWLRKEPTFWQKADVSVLFQMITW
jgi:hypothetical protein